MEGVEAHGVFKVVAGEEPLPELKCMRASDLRDPLRDKVADEENKNALSLISYFNLKFLPIYAGLALTIQEKAIVGYSFNIS